MSEPSCTFTVINNINLLALNDDSVVIDQFTGIPKPASTAVIGDYLVLGDTQACYDLINWNSNEPLAKRFSDRATFKLLKESNLALLQPCKKETNLELKLQSIVNVARQAKIISNEFAKIALDGLTGNGTQKIQIKYVPFSTFQIFGDTERAAGAVIDTKDLIIYINSEEDTLDSCSPEFFMEVIHELKHYYQVVKGSHEKSTVAENETDAMIEGLYCHNFFSEDLDYFVKKHLDTVQRKYKVLLEATRNALSGVPKNLEEYIKKISFVSPYSIGIEATKALAAGDMKTFNKKRAEAYEQMRLFHINLQLRDLLTNMGEYSEYYDRYEPRISQLFDLFEQGKISEAERLIFFCRLLNQPASQAVLKFLRICKLIHWMKKNIRANSTDKAQNLINWLEEQSTSPSGTARQSN